VRLPRPWARLMGRAVTVAACLTVFVLVVAQFAHAIAMNLDLAHRLAATQVRRAEIVADNARLRREIRRLETPRGAVPAIHDELHLVRPHEEIIYLQTDGHAAGR